MSLVDYFDQLAEIALGWLGWTEEQALASDVNAIVVAYGGRTDMLRWIFGSSEEESAAPAPQTTAEMKQPQTVTPTLFKALFGHKISEG